MGLLDKIKEAAKNAAEKNALAEKELQENLKKLTDYVHEHIKELDDIFVENEGELYPIKASLIWGETKNKEEINDIVFELSLDDEGYKSASFKEQLLGNYENHRYIDTEIGRLYVSAGEGAVNLKPRLSFDFYIKKKERAIKAILDSIDAATKLTSAEIMEKIKYSNAQRTKEDDSRLQEAWDKCITSLIKAMPNPEISDWMNEIKLCNTELSKDSEEMILEAWEERLITLISSKPDPNADELIKEIKLSYTEIKKDTEYSIRETWKERVHHLMSLLEMPSAKDAIRTIQEYELLQKQLASDKNLSDNEEYAAEWKKKKKEVIDYAKLYYMDEPSVKQYLTPWWKRLFKRG